MFVVVTYDVSTETQAGRRRLRRVAKVCLNYGQRVQNSVFECRFSKATYEIFEESILAEIDEGEDNLRIYTITEPVKKHIREFGKFKAVDFEEPLIC